MGFFFARSEPYAVHTDRDKGDHQKQRELRVDGPLDEVFDRHCVGLRLGVRYVEAQESAESPVPPLGDVVEFGLGVTDGGQPADIEGLLKIADEYDLTVIWDACHGFGGHWQGEPIGSQRDMAIFSFHPVKNITTGEGGMVVTDDDELATRLRRLRSFDMDYDPDGHENEPWYQVSEGVGYNYNVTDLQAALGLAQLDRLDEFKTRRDEIIAQYDEAFNDVSGLRTPPEPTNADPMYHLYAVEVGEAFGCDRKEFVNALHAENLGVQVHYVPLHYHPYFQEEFGYAEGDFPETERVYDGLVSLPLHAEMDDKDIEDVITAVRRLHEYHA